MRQRKRKTKIYCTDNLFVYDTENGTFSIEGIIDRERIRQRAKTLDEAKLKCHLFEEAKHLFVEKDTILSTENLFLCIDTYKKIKNKSLGGASDLVDIVSGNTSWIYMTPDDLIGNQEPLKLRLLLPQGKCLYK